MADSIDPRALRGDPDFDAYLDALDAALDLPAAERTDIRDEIAAHLSDARAEAVAAGAADGAATSQALRSFGEPARLARELTEARHRRSALFAAAGAGTWAAAEAAVRGFILGIALIATVLGAAGTLTAIAFRAGLIGVWSIDDHGWYTAILGIAFCFAAWHGGRSLVAAVARRSHRRAEHVRPFAAAVAGFGVAWLSLAWFQAPQSPVSVVVLGLVPIVFVVAAVTGSDRETARSKAARRASLALFTTVVVAVPLLLVFAGTAVSYGELSAVGSGPYGSMEELLTAQGFDMPGRFVPDPPELGDAGWSIDHGVARVTLGSAAAVTTRWHDLRVEAWRSDLSSGTLVRDHPAPFATAPMGRIGDDSLSGSVRVDRTRDVSAFWLVVTGTAADSGRDLVASLGGTNTTFTGSVLDWLAAP